MPDEGRHAPSQVIDLTRESEFALGALRVRPASCEALGPNGVVRLEPRIMQVLVLLCRRRPEVVGRDELIACCWRGVVVGDNSIQRAVSRIRKLADLSSPPAFSVETVAKIGYRLVEVSGQTAEPPPAPALAALLGRRARLWLAGGLLAAAAAALSLWLALPPAGPATIAALAFDTGGDQSLSAFSEGLASRISGVVSANDLLSVSPARAEAFRRESADGVDLVVDGMVERRGDAIAVTARVEHASSGLTLWSQQIERDAEERVELQEQVAARVVDVVRCALNLEPPSRGRLSPQSLSLFLRACDAERFNQGDWERVRLLARQLTEREPSLALGWALLASGAANQSYFAPAAQAEALAEEAKRAAERALRLDPENAEALLSLAVLAPSVDEQVALRERAVRAEPDSAQACHNYAYQLLSLGRIEEAARFASRAHALDPMSRRYAAHAAPMLASAGREEEALAIARQLPRVWPDYVSGQANFMLVSMFSGSAEDARRALARAERDRSYGMSGEALALMSEFVVVRAGATPTQRAALAERIVRANRAGRIETLGTIMLLSELGEIDRAMSVAEPFFASIEPHRWYLLFLAPMENIRRDPRFMRLAAAAGVLDYWRASDRWPDFCSDPAWPYRCEAAARAYE